MAGTDPLSTYPVLGVGGLPLARVKRLAGEFTWVAIGQLAAVAGGLAGVRLLTSVLSPASYGELALGMTAAMLMQQVAIGPVAGALLRFFAPALEARQLRGYLGGAWALLAQATLPLSAIATVAALGLWLGGAGRWIGLTLGAFLFSLLSGFGSALDGVQNAARQRAVVAWHQGLGQWLRFLVALALIGALGATSGAAMLGYALASGVVLISQIVFLRQRILSLTQHEEAPNRDKVHYWTLQMRGYAWPFAAWGVFSWAQMASDRWALQAAKTSNAVGLYAALYQLGYYPMALLSGLLVQLVSPVLFSRAGDGSEPDRTAKSHRMNDLLVAGSALLTLAAAGLAFLLHGRLFSILVAPEYRSVSALLPAMVLSGGLFATGQVAVLSVLSGAETKSLIAPKIATAVLGVVLNFAGAFWFGLRGVVTAGVVVAALYLLWILALVKRQRDALAHPCPGPAST